MADTVTLSFRVPAEKAERLDKLAKATERPRSWLLERAIDRYIDNEEWQVAHIKQGMAELDRGEGVPQEQIEAWARRLRTNRKRATRR